MPSATALSISSKSEVAWLSSDGTLRVWDGDTVSSSHSLPNPRLISFSTHIITSHDDPPHIHHTNLATGTSTTTTCTGVAIALSAHPHTVFATFHDAAITIAKYDGATIATLPHATAPFSAAFNPTASNLATADSRGFIRVFDHEQQLFALNAHATVAGLAWSDTHLASAGWDGAARVWDVAGRPVVTLRPGRGKLHTVALSPDGSLLAAAGARGGVSVWRIPERRPLAVHTAHEAAVFALSFMPDGRHVVSGSADGTVRLFGVPTKPQLITEASPQPNKEPEGLYHVTPVQHILKGQRADRQLLYVPSTIVSLTCPVCSLAYDDVRRKPVCSGVCGHTYACSLCSEQLWSTDEAPRCPICRARLVDVALNYELLTILSAAHGSSSGTSARQEPERSDRDHIDLGRLSWMEESELAYATFHSSTIYNGRLDGEVVAVRVPRTIEGSHSGPTAAAAIAATKAETERHLFCLRKLRGPHIVQLYGVSRTDPPESRLVVVSELPPGGTLSDNLAQLREQERTLPSESMVSLSLQLIKAVRFLHESEMSAGHALSPAAVGLSMPIAEDWAMQHHVKFIELGGTISKAEFATDAERTFPSDYVGYLPPELLDEDPSVYQKETAFKRACQADMYSLGVLLWAIASAKHPFEGLRPAQVVAAVIGRDERPGFPPASLPAALQDLISHLWAADPDSRPNALQACQILESVPSAPPP